MNTEDAIEIARNDIQKIHDRISNAQADSSFTGFLKALLAQKQKVLDELELLLRNGVTKIEASSYWD